MASRTAEARFWSKVQADDALGCWIWTGAKCPNGYGSFGYNSKTVRAYRWAYEHLRAEIDPAWLSLDHLCSNPPCVNPWHLEPVTPWVNMKRAAGRGRLRSFYMNPAEAEGRPVRRPMPKYRRVIEKLRELIPAGLAPYEVTPAALQRYEGMRAGEAAAVMSWLAAYGLVDHGWYRKAGTRSPDGVVAETAHYPERLVFHGDPGVCISVPGARLVWAKTRDYDAMAPEAMAAAVAQFIAA